MNVIRMPQWVSMPLFALSAVGASMSSYAQDNDLRPTIYGRVNLTEVLNKPRGGGSDPEFISNASRLGIMGAIPLTNDLEIIYQTEYEIDLDHGSFDSDLTSQRSSFIGLKGELGTILAGKYDTPTRQLQNKIDLFNDLQGDIKTLVVAENRPNDTLYYSTPSIIGFVLSFARVLDGQRSVQDRVSKSTSLAVAYTHGDFYAGIGHDNNLNDNDVVRVVTQYQIGKLQLGALYETSESNTNLRSEQRGVVVSASYKIDKFVLKAQTGMSDQKREGGQLHSVGVDYVISSDTKLFGFFTATRADNRAVDFDQYGLGFEFRF